MTDLTAKMCQIQFSDAV